MGVFTREPLDAEAPLAGGDGTVGAVVSFAGVVRADERDGRRVVALRYEAYEPMAGREVGRLERAARARWPVHGIRVRHRLGVVRAGEAAVRVTVTASHRAEAFAAAQFMMDGIKRAAPIWKQELHADGPGAWAGCEHAREEPEARPAHV